MVTVLILQGVSGSGKSTYADWLTPREKVFVVSADDYFEKPGGPWVFDAKQLPNAHKQCFTRFLELCWGDLIPRATLVVSNTNISPYEYSPYVRVAQALLQDPVIKLITFRRPLVSCLREGVHKVPAHIVREQERRLLTEPQMPGLIQEFVFND